MSEAPPPRHVFLIDASGYIFRAYHALPPLNRADGTPTNALHGFVNMVLKLLETTDADHIAAVFDSAKVSFRNRIYPAHGAIVHILWPRDAFETEEPKPETVG